jgi:hypothetical protein
MGFANYGVFLGSLIILTVILFLIGLIFKNKFIIVRYSFWTLSISFLVLSVLTSLKNEKRLNKYELEIVGVFKLSKESKLGDYNYEDYKNVSLTVKSDNTFEIKPSAPFIDLTNGNWNLFDDGDISFIEIDGDGRTHTAYGSSYDWIFKFPSPQSGEQVKLIKFEKEYK